MYKVVIDSNIWVSFLIGKSLRNLLQFIRNEQIIIVTCKEQIQELTIVFHKPKLQKYFQTNQITTFFSFLKGVSLVVPIQKIATLCRDPKDDYLLALSVASDADFLVTGDADLLEMHRINNTIILKYVDFEKVINDVM
jgi:putative PIN family toxin of toxin-antitoxin system